MQSNPSQNERKRRYDSKLPFKHKGRSTRRRKKRLMTEKKKEGKACKEERMSFDIFFAELSVISECSPETRGLLAASNLGVDGADVSVLSVFDAKWDERG